MDRVERLRRLLDGAACAVCGVPVPWRRIRVVAEREDLAFVEYRCEGCGSASLGMVTPADPTEVGMATAPGDLGRVVHAAAADPTAAGRGRTSAPPIAAADVRTMREFLAGFRGDLRDLVGEPDDRSAPGASA